MATQKTEKTKGTITVAKASSYKDEVKNAPLFPVVGIGASAGGLSAFEAFFRGMPADQDPGMAFVLIQHLSPDHKSMLSEIIRRHTRMKVYDVEDGMIVQPNCTYIIPPSRDMAYMNGKLYLYAQESPRGQHMPIDFFFRSMAEELHERATCIILSGTGSDGTLGLKVIKQEGGMAIVQSPDHAEYDDMPLSAISTGLVDYQLPPGEMAGQVISYAAQAYRITHKQELSDPSQSDIALNKICTILRNQTGHNFSNYKSSTINRRIEKRTAVLQIETLDSYIKYLQQSPEEVEALFRDTLIGVTYFFRDKNAFQQLEESVLPKIFQGKPPGSIIRVWCAGCSTGEEAYSLAILLHEQLEKQYTNYQIQVFATDIDGQAIAKARTGVYSDSISSDVTPERLARFFTFEPVSNTYRINKFVRDQLIFSEQSLIKDPPFSKMDLISCRNLLIYLDSELQKKIIPLFHYALNPGGSLFLGGSETISDFNYLFTTLDRKYKIYQRKENLKASLKESQRGFLNRALTPTGGIELEVPKMEIRAISKPKIPLRELTEQAILKESQLSGALINNRGDILYLHGRTGMFLEPSPGEAGINNILKMAREGLEHHLTTALQMATVKTDPVRLIDLNIKTNGHFTKVNLTVKQAVAPGILGESPLYLVILEEKKGQEPKRTDKPQKSKETVFDSDTQIIELQSELRIKEEYLKTVNEQLESSNEELKSSYEEMQSINEELQSTNEELETSKEELQSINEELYTVNSELQVKVHDLSQANNDMNNLLAGTNIATIFLDCQQNIMRFTPTANKIFNIIASDVSRPVAHFVSNLVNYQQMSKDVKEVMDTLIPRNTEVQTIDGKWFNMVIQPYRTIENVIEGTVITFIDITEMKIARDKLANSELSYRTLFETAREGILILDEATGKINKVNPYLVELLGFSENQLLEKSIWEIGAFRDIAENKYRFHDLKKKKSMRYDDLPLTTQDGRVVEVEFISNVFKEEGRKIIQCNIRDMARVNNEQQPRIGDENGGA